MQGTIAITGLVWCDFVVWTPQGISVERIAADKHFWEGFKDVLLLFYYKGLLPELGSSIASLNSQSKNLFSRNKDIHAVKQQPLYKLLV